MPDPTVVAEAYLALWNEADPARRRAMLHDAWTPAARYADPMMQGEGLDGIAAMIAGAREQFAGHHFTLSGSPDGHGRFVRFSWRLAPHGGAAVASGTDVVSVDAQGRIEQVIGFLDGAGHA